MDSSGKPEPDAADSPEADPYEVARLIALQYLSVAPRTRAQVAERLARRGVPDDVAEALLDRLEQVQLLDDAEFARQWVSTRHSGRGLAPRALAHELRRRGVDERVVREAVSEVSPDDELSAARLLVRRRLPATRQDDPSRRTRRIAAALARKGYTSDVAFRALREELAAQATIDEADLGLPGDNGHPEDVDSTDRAGSSDSAGDGHGASAADPKVGLD